MKTKIVLYQTLAHPVNGYWDGGAKDTFRWTIEKYFLRREGKRKYVRVGSWGANHWFEVTKGKTNKQTLTNAKRHLQWATRVPSTFEYAEEN